MRDPWTELHFFIQVEIATAAESCITTALSPEAYAACRRRIQTLREIAEKMKSLVSNPEQPGTDVV